MAEPARPNGMLKLKTSVAEPVKNFWTRKHVVREDYCPDPAGAYAGGNNFRCENRSGRGAVREVFHEKALAPRPKIWRDEKIDGLDKERVSPPPGWRSQPGGTSIRSFGRSMKWNESFGGQSAGSFFTRLPALFIPPESLLRGASYLGTTIFWQWYSGRVKRVISHK